MLLRKGVLLSRPTGQAYKRDKVLGASTISLGMRMSAITSDGAVRATEQPARIARATMSTVRAWQARNCAHDKDLVVTGTSLSRWTFQVANSA